MVPAMDRVSMARARFGLALGLALALVDLGCARLPWKKQKPEPAMLGRMSDTSDIYAMDRRPAGPPVAVATGSTAVNPNDFQEVAMAVRPAEATPSLATGGVTLQPPTSIEPRAASRPAKPSDGVPNAGLLLASGEHRSSSEPTTSAAQVVAEARSAIDGMANYEVSLHRRERVNGELLPEEDVVLAIRREPRAVRLTWVDGPNKGREVIFRADEPGGSMHIKLANPALPRMSLPPDSPLVMRNSRHPVTEAGLDSIVEGLENAVKAADASGIRYAGLEAADGLEQPAHCLVRTSPTGERWRIYLDASSHLPALVMAHDAGGELLERYEFRNVRGNLPELSSSEAFDTNARWGKPAGLFGRMARGDSSEPSSPPR